MPHRSTATGPKQGIERLHATPRGARAHDIATFDVHRHANRTCRCKTHVAGHNDLHQPLHDIMPFTLIVPDLHHRIRPTPMPGKAAGYDMEL
jgi:hypothetical protein